MQDCINNCLDYYTKTFIFVQNSRMSKLRLVDAFDKSCFMINYILCKDDGYFFSNINILQFMLLEPLDKGKKTINKLPKKIIVASSLFIKDKKVTAIGTIVL